MDVEKGSQLDSNGSDGDHMMTKDDRLRSAGLSKKFLSAGGMTVTFHNLTYTVINSQNKKEKISLLMNVSGFLQAGEMSALMGPSGSGKTTLLDVLAGRKTVGSQTGEILFAGNTSTKQFLRRFTGYVEQFDTLLDVLTVEEMLLYTAELKRPLSEPWAEKKSAVDELLKVLALEPCRHVKIGNPLNRGISGGQAKRVNIGIAVCVLCCAVLCPCVVYICTTKSVPSLFVLTHPYRN